MTYGKDDLESGGKNGKSIGEITEVPVSPSGKSSVTSSYEAVMRADTPFFHVDLTAAIRAAERTAERASAIEDATAVI